SPEPPGYGAYSLDPAVSGPPISGASGSTMGMPGYGGPVSGAPQPAYGAPMGAPVAAPARRGGATMILAAATVLFLLLAGVMTALFVVKNSDYDKEKTKVAPRDSTLSDQAKQ